jgi:hypothetical protein
MRTRVQRRVAPDQQGQRVEKAPLCRRGQRARAQWVCIVKSDSPYPNSDKRFWQSLTQERFFRGLGEQDPEPPPEKRLQPRGYDFLWFLRPPLATNRDWPPHHSFDSAAHLPRFQNPHGTSCPRGWTDRFSTRPSEESWFRAPLLVGFSSDLNRGCPNLHMDARWRNDPIRRGFVPRFAYFPFGAGRASASVPASLLVWQRNLTGGKTTLNELVSNRAGHAHPR